MAHAPPAIPLPNIPGATSSPSEWEAALLDAVEGYYTDSPSPWTIGRPRIIETFYEPHVETGPAFAAHEPGIYTDVGDAPLPMEPWILENLGYEGVGVYPVLPGPVGDTNPPVPVPSARIEPVPAPTIYEEEDETYPEDFPMDDTYAPPAVTEYDEGDWPTGSIFAPGEIWGPSTPGIHRLDRDEEPEMAHDWGHLLRQGLEGLGGFAQPAQQTFGNSTASYVGATGGTGPTQIPGGSAAMPPSGAFRVDQYGRVVRCRRRRRRLLTNSDLKDLAALKTITGNNDALKMAVIKAVR